MIYWGHHTPQRGGIEVLTSEERNDSPLSFSIFVNIFLLLNMNLKALSLLVNVYTFSNRNAAIQRYLYFKLILKSTGFILLTCFGVYTFVC